MAAEAHSAASQYQIEATRFSDGEKYSHKMERGSLLLYETKDHLSFHEGSSSARIGLRFLGLDFLQEQIMMTSFCRGALAWSSNGSPFSGFKKLKDNTGVSVSLEELPLYLILPFPQILYGIRVSYDQPI